MRINSNTQKNPILDEEIARKIVFSVEFKLALNPEVSPPIQQSQGPAKSFKAMKLRAKEDAKQAPAAVQAQGEAQDVEMTDQLVAQYDKGMSDLLKSVIVVGT